MKYVVHIAKDGKLYFHIEADDEVESPGHVRELAQELVETFQDFPEEPAETRSKFRAEVEH